MLKQELEHDEIFEDTWEARENERLPHVQNDVLSIAFINARYTMEMEEVTNFGLKNSLTLPSLAIKYFSCLKDENDELISTYTDLFMRNFLRDWIKGVKCNACNQYHKSETSDEVFNNIPRELNVNGNICNLLERYFVFSHQYEKLYTKEFDSKYEDYRDVIQRETTDFINKNFDMLRIYKKLSKLGSKILRCIWCY